MAKSMQHWNGKPCVVIDTETTGLDCDWHEIWQICILPVDSNFKPRSDVPPFYLEMKPQMPNHIDPFVWKMNRVALTKACERGHDPDTVVELLNHWYEKLNVPLNKNGNPLNVIPLGHNYGFDRAFIIKWLGVEEYQRMFHYHYRDTMVSSHYLNDRAAMHGRKVPYSKCSLSNLAYKHDIEFKAHDALQDCIATAAVYRAMLLEGLLG